MLSNSEILMLTRRLDPTASISGNVLSTTLPLSRLRRLFAGEGHDFDAQGIALHKRAKDVLKITRNDPRDPWYHVYRPSADADGGWEPLGHVEKMGTGSWSAYRSPSEVKHDFKTRNAAAQWLEEQAHEPR